MRTYRGIALTALALSFVAFACTDDSDGDPPVCEAEALRCNGNSLERCSEDRRSFETLESCEKGCSAGACRVCTATESRCEGAERLRCNADGSDFEVAETCATGCGDDSAGRCNDTVCNPEEVRCGEDGETLEGCLADRSGFEARERCEFGCAETACLMPACVVGELRCEGREIQVCAEDRRGFELESECPIACVDGGEIRCGAPQALLCDNEDYDAASCGPELWPGPEPRFTLWLHNRGDAQLLLEAVELDADFLALAEELSRMTVDAQGAPLAIAFEGLADGRSDVVLRLNSETGTQAHTLRLTPRAELPYVLIGEAEEDGPFMPYVGGERLTYIRGFQGLGDVYPTVLMAGLPTEPPLRATARVLHENISWGLIMARETPFTAEGEGPLLARRFRITISGENDNIELEDAPVSLFVELITPDGETMIHHQTPLLSLDVEDFP